MTDAMRSQARRLFDAGVAAADPAQAVARALAEKPLHQDRPVHALAIGKAAIPMMKAVQAAMQPAGALVVTNRENLSNLPSVRVMGAGHPVPDADGLRAAVAAEDFVAKAAGAGGQVLALISGGGSAMLPAPVAGVSLDDKAALSRSLLACGADITQMNLIRQALSRLKGGGLLRAAAAAPVTALILSDVVGDDLRVVASGPTVAPIGPVSQARALLQELHLWDGAPESVRQALLRPDRPPPGATADNRLIGGNHHSLMAMAAAAPEAQVQQPPLVGDVAKAAARVVAALDRPGVALFGGETTVVLRGDGKGGRNQELALRVALLAARKGWRNWVFLSGGTDGRDGPTDAAGGLVDAGSLARMRAAGVDPDQALSRNDSYRALAGSGDLLLTGATGTNVADLQVLIRG